MNRYQTNPSGGHGADSSRDSTIRYRLMQNNTTRPTDPYGQGVLRFSVNLFYGCLACFSLGIFIQETALLFLILVQLWYVLYSKQRVGLPLCGGKSGLFLFGSIILSAMVSKLTVESSSGGEIHWALVAFWTISMPMVGLMDWKKLHRVLVLVSIPGMLYSIYWLLQPDEILWSMKVGFHMYPRAFGFVSNPITNAEGLVMIICWSLARLQNGVSPRERKLLITHLAFAAAIILFSRVRSGIVALALLLALCGFVSPKLRQISLITLAILILGFIAVIPIFGFNMASIHERIDLYYNALSLLSERPILGIGPGRFDAFPVEGAVVSGHPHNTLLAIAVETGFLGLAAYFAFMFVIGRRVWLLYHAYRDHDSELRWATHAMLLVFLGYWIFGMFDYNFGDSELLILHTFHWALIARIPLPAVNQPKETP